MISSAVRTAARAASAIAIVGIVCASSSCILFSASDGTVQCEADADCSDFSGTVCSSEGVCILPAAATTASSTSTTTSGTGGGSGTGGSGPSCLSNQQCVDEAAGLPSICRNGECQSLLTEDCTQVLNEAGVAAEDPFLIGWLGNLTGPSAAESTYWLQGTKLAVDEIEAVAKGLPLGTGARRPLVVLACDEFADPVRAANHLVQDLGVPAIFGPVFSSSMLAIATEVTIPENVLLLTDVSSPSLADLPDEGLVWSVKPNSGLEAPALAKLVAQVEADIREERALDPGDFIKVAMLVISDDYGTRMADLVGSALEVNGFPAAASENTDYFLRRNYEDPAITPDADPDYSADINALLDFEPDMVIGIGGKEVFINISLPVEQMWPEGLPRPEYVATGRGSRVETGTLFGAEIEDVGSRFQGVRIEAVEGPEFDNFRLRFQGSNNNYPPAAGTEAHYDGIYLLAYSALAAGTVPTLDGTAMATGLAKLNPPGNAANVGPSALAATINVLVAGGDVDLDGASGYLEFDVAAGSPQADVVVYCIGTGFAVAPAGQSYDPGSDELVGTFECP